MNTPRQPAEDEKTDARSLVCGRAMTTAPEHYYPAMYQGRVIYFCTEFCLDAFRADPDRFYIAHSRKKNQQAG